MGRFCAILLFCSVIWITSSPLVWGAGFLIFEQGTKAMGMAGAFTATADDPSAIFNNPAGITQLDGTRISMGNTFIRNDQKYDVPSETVTPARTYHEEMHSRTFYLPHLYITQEISDTLTFGFGYSSPFGIGTNWSDHSVGNSVADEAHLKTYDFNPNIAFKLNPKLSLALGFHYTRTKVQIIRQIGAESFNSILQLIGVSETPVSSFERLGAAQLGRLKIDARGGGWSYNAALHYKINEFWKVGFSYRSDTKIEVAHSENTVDAWPSGNVLFSPILNFNPVLRTHTRGKTRINLPGIFLAGISTTMFDRWNIEFDLQYTTWNHFDDVVIELNPGLGVMTPLGPTTSDELVLEEDWENVFGFHFGTEYQYTDNFAVRAGYFYDKTPIPDRTLGAVLPGSDRHNFSLGCGYTKGDWTIDTAYIWSNFENRSTRTNYQDFNASYESNFHLFGVTVTRKI